MPVPPILFGARHRYEHEEVPRVGIEPTRSLAPQDFKFSPVEHQDRRFPFSSSHPVT